MKIIFLDIDGVLNSDSYDRERGSDDGNIDKSRLPLLKALIDKTDAKIVLSSSWREHWEKDEDLLSDVGKELNETFVSAGLEIFDKTPVLSSRSEEISFWLSCHTETESFVIFDDYPFGWGNLSEHLVLTSRRIGRGLENNHIEKAEQIII